MKPKITLLRIIFSILFIDISAVNCTDLPVAAPGTLQKPNDRGTYDWSIENGTNYGTLIRYKLVLKPKTLIKQNY